MRRRWLAAALLLAGCAPAPTQVFVHVDAEPGVRAMTRSIGIRIWGRSRDGEFRVDPDVIEPGWKVCIVETEVAESLIEEEN